MVKYSNPSNQRPSSQASIDPRQTKDEDVVMGTAQLVRRDSWWMRDAYNTAK